NRGRKGVSDLAIGSRLPSDDVPARRKSLDHRSHSHRQARKAFESSWWRLLCECASINPELLPSGPGPRWPKVRPTVLLGASNQSWRNPVGALGPELRSLPTIRSHFIDEKLAHCRRRIDGRFGPSEGVVDVRSGSDHHYTRPQLRHPIIT